LNHEYTSDNDRPYEGSSQHLKKFSDSQNFQKQMSIHSSSSLPLGKKTLIPQRKTQQHQQQLQTSLSQYLNKSHAEAMVDYDNSKINNNNNNNNTINTNLNNIFNIFDIDNSSLKTISNHRQSSQQHAITSISNDTGRSKLVKNHKNDTSLLAKQINLNSLANMMMLRQQQQQQQQQQHQIQQKNSANLLKNSKIIFIKQNYSL
jgi:hypothetical protein